MYVANGLIYIVSLTNRNGHGRSRGFANIRNMFLKFITKAYLQSIWKQSQALLIDGNAFVVIARRL